MKTILFILLCIIGCPIIYFIIWGLPIFISEYLKSRKLDKSFRECEAAHKNGDINATVRLARMYESSQNIVKAIELYEYAIFHGNMTAKYELAYIYDHGTYVSQDYNKAAYWYLEYVKDYRGKQYHQRNQREIIDIDYQNALFNLRNMFKHIKEEAEKGSLYSIYIIGLYFETGATVLKDFDEAIKWYKKAADQDYLLAIEALERLDAKQ